VPNSQVKTDFLYVYGMIPVEELEQTCFPCIKGIDENDICVKQVRQLAVVFTQVNPITFSQEKIDQQLQNPEWLEEKAYHHHHLIDTLCRHYTTLPLSFCTIFQNEANLDHFLSDQYEKIFSKLDALKEKEEWNVKVFSRRQEATAYISTNHPKITDLREKLSSMPKGKQFIMKKKLEQMITGELENQQSLWWNDIQQVLARITEDKHLRINWGREMTGRNDDMMANCDFLVAKVNSQPFLQLLRETEMKYEEYGCTFQVTGPWPPYHFAQWTREN
jgi:Gas vesicle synthesis protein GvpL/GvpF